MHAVACFMKMISFHHVFHDVRWLCLKVNKLKKQGHELKPSKVENTILGVDIKTYEKALTYPKCLKFREYVMFVMMPTFCYQLIYPLGEKIDWKKVVIKFN